MLKFINGNKLLIIIFILALFLRIYKLDTFPLGFHVDEAKVAWNALSILKTGKDDHGNFLTLHYNSFGDYRPTGIFYVTIPSLLLFGRTNFAVRFPSAFLGALTIFPIYLLTSHFSKNKRLGLLSAFLLAILPWHIATSRATSEVVISAFLILSSLTLLIKKPRLSFVLLTTSFLFYHSARVMGPILMLVWIAFLWQKIEKSNLTKKILIGFFLTTLLSLILLLSPAGRGRFNQVKLDHPNLRNIILEYASYFNPSFFIGDIAKPFRYTTHDVGIVSIPIFICFLLGTFTIIKTHKQNLPLRGKNKILLFLFALGPLPAALTLEDSPNLHRAFFMLPFFVIIGAIGLHSLSEHHKNLTKLLLLTLLLTFITFSRNYLDTEHNFAFGFRDPQTKRLSLYLADVANNWDKIYITNDPDSPYPWYAFFNNIDPHDFNLAQQKNIDGKWTYQNLIWDNTKCPAGKAFDDTKKDPSIKKILVIDHGACFTDFTKSPEAKILREFTFNNHVNYRVWEYQPAR